MNIIPEILAPAGDSACALAAIAAGADAVYLGLKHFSARMQADNFATGELARLVEYAHQKNVRIYVAMNTLIKPQDTESAYNLISRLERDVHPDAIILQDPGLLYLAKQANFSGELHISTLANATHAAALSVAQEMGASRVILPRELSIDEIRTMGAACPEGLTLECFVHGALCYCVSGRCYWSSYMGGKSGLRGRCVQPCRRVYTQGGHMMAQRAQAQSVQQKGQYDARLKSPSARRPAQRTRKAQKGRYFSCLDLSIDVLAKTLLEVPNLASWKIEGRKKGPHYVFHVVTAYKMLRDNPADPKAKKMAVSFLEMALGRPSSRARFLPQKHYVPTAPNDSTSSGLLVGKVHMDAEGRPCIKTHHELVPQDYLRIGVEDERWHDTMSVTRRVPKAGTLVLRVAKHKTPKAGTMVFLIDRREHELVNIIKSAQQELARFNVPTGGAITSKPRFSAAVRAKKRPDMLLTSHVPHGRETRGSKNMHMALWLSPKAQELSRTIVPRVAWWLPPVIWPEEEQSYQRLVAQMCRSGATHFVCNAPWQMGLFSSAQQDARQPLDIMAGPFCNIANAGYLCTLQGMGFSAAFVSPELTADDLLALPAQSPLPLGCVIEGFWPVGISRFGLLGIRPSEPFASPKGEIFWAKNYGSNVWLYPGWPLNLTEKRAQLEKAGYSFFAHMKENVPDSLPEMQRHGLFNWDGELL